MAPTAPDWADLAVEQLHWHWEAQLRPRLDGLTDDEYFWEPVPGCANLRVDGERVVRDPIPPGADPPPVTTIAVRLAHIAVDNFLLRTNHHVGDRSVRVDDVRWPATAGAALALLDEAYAGWHAAVSGLDEEALARQSVGPPDTLDAEFPFAAVILHVNREVIHHGAEVALLRDLYRASGGAPVSVVGR